MILKQQDYTLYSEDDHYTWAKLFQKQTELIKTKASKVYLEALNKLDLNRTKVEDITDLSNKLESISGWSLIPVSGLIPTKDFFYMLINKKYPVTVSMRKPEEIDFSKDPDIFHDVFGHLPLLTNEKFTKFLTAYSTIAIKYVNNEHAIEFLGRLYWYTYEMGILLENDQYKPYGGAVITSSEEMENIHRPVAAKYPFNVDRIFKTAYNPYKLQNNYFVIKSFDELFDCIETLEETLKAHLLIREKEHTIRDFLLWK